MLAINRIWAHDSLQRIWRKVQRLFRVLRQARQRGGWARVAARIAAWRVLPSWLLFVHDIDLLVLDALNPRSVRPFAARYEVGLADRSILEELVACTDTPRSEALRRAALERVFDLGASCVAVRDGGRVVAYACLFAGTYHLTYDDYGPRTLPIELDGGAVYIGNCFIVPEYRMKGLFPQLLAACVASRPPGTRVFGHIDVGNDHSFASHRRLGFTPLLTITCLSVGRARFFFQRPFGSHRRSRVDPRARVRLLEQDGAYRLAAEAPRAP